MFLWMKRRKFQSAEDILVEFGKVEEIDRMLEIIQ